MSEENANGIGTGEYRSPLEAAAMQETGFKPDETQTDIPRLHPGAQNHFTEPDNTFTNPDRTWKDDYKDLGLSTDPNRQNPVVHPIEGELTEQNMPRTMEQLRLMKEGRERILNGQAPKIEAQPVDITAYIKAQARFLETQTWFLEQKNAPTPEYVNAITAYSKAQRDYIRAQNELLHQLGVI